MRDGEIMTFDDNVCFNGSWSAGKIGRPTAGRRGRGGKDLLVKPEWLRQGVVYKNPRAYHENSGICYIPEFSFDGVPHTEDGWFAVRDIIAVNGKDAVYEHDDVVEECDGDEYAADLVFALIDWDHPNSRYNQLDEEDFECIERRRREGCVGFAE